MYGSNIVGLSEDYELLRLHSPVLRLSWIQIFQYLKLKFDSN